MESFSRPSVSVAAGVLALVALGSFAVGFKDNFSRPGDASPRLPAAVGAPASSVGEPTVAQPLTEPVPTSADVEPASSAAPASSATPKKHKPAPDATDAAADQIDASDTPADQPARTPRSATPRSATPPSSSRPVPPPSAQPASDAIGDLLPPH